MFPRNGQEQRGWLVPRLPVPGDPHPMELTAPLMELEQLGLCQVLLIRKSIAWWGCGCWGAPGSPAPTSAAVSLSMGWNSFAQVLIL